MDAVDSQKTEIKKEEHNTRLFSVPWWNILAPVIVQGIFWPVWFLVFKIFGRLRIEGTEHVMRARQLAYAKRRGVIITPNHVSAMDFAFPLVAISPLSFLFPLFFVAHGSDYYRGEKDLGWLRFLYARDTILLFAGAHPYIKGKRDYKKSMPYHTALLKQGSTVCIFPEGTTKNKAKRSKARGGAGFLAEETNAIVLPVHIAGVVGSSFSSFFARKHSITITYGAPLEANALIDAEEPIPERYQNAAEKILDAVYALESTETILEDATLVS